MKTVIICGCGFLGSHLADELPKMFYSQDLFPYRFRFIDFDNWEDRNAANQAVDLETAKTNENKAVTCARIASRYVPSNQAEFVDEKLTFENVDRLLKDAVLTIDAVDNVPTRQLLWGAGISGEYGPVLHAGLSRQGSGMITWSNDKFCTFPFRPQDMIGRELAEQDIKELPCKMYKYRTAGMVLIQAVAKATGLYFGKDPWDMFEGAEQKGMMTCWLTDVNGSKILTTDDYLSSTGFFPIHGE